MVPRLKTTFDLWCKETYVHVTALDSITSLRNLHTVRAHSERLTCERLRNEDRAEEER